MAYEIEVLDGDGWTVQMLLYLRLNKSRFWVHEMRRFPRGKRSVVSLHKIRLKHSKGYCGNHPGACALTGDAAPHRRGNWLEGADWVAFHDMVNDMLDAAKVQANVHSAGRRFWIRRGNQRRVRFWGRNLLTRAAEFFPDEPDSYVVNVGGSGLRSVFPPGTPGIPEWRVEAEQMQPYVELFRAGVH